MKTLYCDSRGDKRFSALYAYVNIDGVKDSIEHFYQNAKRDEDGNVPGKGKPVAYFIWKGKIYKKEDLSRFYENLWIIYFKQNPDLLEIASKYDVFIDRFRGKSINCQADVIAKIVEENKGVKYEKNN